MEMLGVIGRRVVAAGVVCLTMACAGPAHRRSEVPFGALDLPAPNSVVAPGPLVVGGWAMDDEGIDVVRVFVNRRFVAETRLTVPRPDLIKAFPAYLHNTEVHGWNLTITLQAGTGAAEILAQAVDSRGATRDLGTVVVTVGSHP